MGDWKSGNGWQKKKEQVHWLKKAGKELKGKFLGKSGESLVETLASMLIIVLAVEILAGALVSSARLNRTAKKSILLKT